MYILHHQTRTRGMTLVELLVAVGLVTLVFGGIMGSFHFMMELVGSSKAQAGALALANQRMEYIRSLEYNDVGTTGGIPDGPLPQNSTTTLNGITYRERVLIGYIDAPEDGEGASDSNGILADYKLAKVEYSWDFRGEQKTISLLSNIIPRGIETTAGGGTLRVNVFDATVQPVSGASVRVYNDTGTTTIDTTRLTNAEGIALFSGAPALSEYEVFVTKDGFSTDQTYAATTTNPTPTTLPFSILESEVSTMNFRIDELSSLTVETIGVPTTGEFADDFDDSTQIDASSNTAVAAGAVTLAGAPGSFSPSGTVLSTAITPGVIDRWDTLTYNATVPLDTTLVVHIYDMSASATPTLIPDADLPGNSTGFLLGTTDLSTLDASIYPSLALEAVLTSSDAATTSVLTQWSVGYTISRPELASIPFTLTSNKLIGDPNVYKFQDSFVTDGTGDVEISDLEWGVYDVAVTDTSYDVAEACGNIPYALNPGVEDTLTLTLVPATQYSYRVRVEDINGAPIPNADVMLSRTGFSDTALTSACGQVFFNSGLGANADYALDIDAFGYESQSLTEVSIVGTETITVVLSEL